MSRTHVLTVCLLFVCIGLLLPSAASAQSARQDGHQVIRLTIAGDAELALIRELEAPGVEIELWSEVLAPGPVELRVSPTGRAMLQATGLPYDVVIPDVQAYWDGLLDGDPDRGFFDQLRTYEEHIQFMQGLVAAYPDLATMFEVGRSVQNRPLWALHITGKGYAKPGVLYHGAQHGNEKAAASLAAFVADHLLTNYHTNPTVAALVDRLDWYILPIMNVDGYVLNQRRNANNVDLNRNWGGPGSGQDPTGGPYPFSEPETRAVRDLILSHPTVRIHVDLHGYTPKIMWPWGHKNENTPHHSRFLMLGGAMRDRVAASGGGTYQIGIIYSTLYQISGGGADYSYGVLGLWGILIELANSTMPNICNHFLTSLVYLGDWLWSIDCNGNGIDDPLDIAGGFSTDLNRNGVPDECEALGDLNCDYAVDFGDINPFVLALTNPTAYATAFPNCNILNGDINGDGRADFGDINPFVRLLTQP